MALTDREREIVDLLRRDPMITPAGIADRLGTTRAAVNVHLSNLGRKGAVLGRGYILSERPPVVVIGGANLDIKARSTRAAIPGTSNPGTAATASGGVARNIAENLGRLGDPTELIAAFGHDPHGERLLDDTRAAGVRLDHVHRGPHATGTYVAVLDESGDLVVAVADMTATDALRPEHLTPAKDLIARAALLILDGNLPALVAAHALDLAHAAGVHVIIDPVSVPKAARLAPLIDRDRPLYAVTPNRDELRALTGRAIDTAIDAAINTAMNTAVDTDEDLLAAAHVLHQRGVQHVWIRLGPQGSLLSTRDEGAHRIAAAPVEVRDVTGAGDAMLAAFAHALLAGHPPLVAARHGHAAAALTLESAHTVRPDLTARLLEQTVERTADQTAVQALAPLRELSSEETLERTLEQALARHPRKAL